MSGMKSRKINNFVQKSLIFSLNYVKAKIERKILRKSFQEQTIFLITILLIKELERDEAKLLSKELQILYLNEKVIIYIKFC